MNAAQAAALAAIAVATVAESFAERWIARRIPFWIREAERRFEIRRARRTIAGGAR